MDQHIFQIKVSNILNASVHVIVSSISTNTATNTRTHHKRNVGFDADIIEILCIVCLAFMADRLRQLHGLPNGFSTLDECVDCRSVEYSRHEISFCILHILLCVQAPTATVAVTATTKND